MQIALLNIPPIERPIGQPLVRCIVAAAIALCSMTVPFETTADSWTPQDQSPATEAVKSTVTELMQVLDDEQLKRPDRAEQRRHEVERIVMRRVSYEEMAKRALGTAWSDITEQERQEFAGLFVQLLRDSFAGRINQHTDEEVIYLGEQREARFAEVRTQLKGQKVDTRVDFRLMHASNDWLVYDVVIDGASIVSNYRSQFTSIMRDVAYAGLVEKMKQKAVAVKFFENNTSP